MLKFYTPSEWYSLFQCPSLIIDDEGRIWKADDYYKIISGAPVGRVDYTKGCVYGEDLGYGLLASAPIAYLETKNGVIQVLDGKKGLFSAPILYIKDDKVYTPEQYTALFDSPSGFLKKEKKKSGDDSSSGNGSGSAENGGSPGCAPGCLGGELGIFAVIVVFLLMGNFLDKLMKTPGQLALFIFMFVELIILTRLQGFKDAFLLRWKYVIAGKSPDFISLCKKNAAICGGLSCVPLVIPSIIMMNHRWGNWIVVLSVMVYVFCMYYVTFSRLMVQEYIPLWPDKGDARGPESKVSAQQPSETKKAESAPAWVPTPVPPESPAPKPKPEPPAPKPEPEPVRRQEPPVSGEPEGGACAFLARKVAEDWVPGGKMYPVIADPNLKINGMRLTVSNYIIRICLESDGSSARLCEILPESVWQKEYSLASFPGFSAPVTDSQRFEIHRAVRDELAKRPYYIVSQDSRTKLVLDRETGAPCFMSTGFDIHLEKKYKVTKVSKKV